MALAMATMREWRAPSGDVTEADLGRLELLHALLAQLGDPQAATVRIEGLCREIPPLAQRLVTTARRRLPMSSMCDVRRALAVLGNQGLESVLLGLLEDLTILKADCDDRDRRSRAIEPR
jgi:hypothetical protein